MYKILWESVRIGLNDIVVMHLEEGGCFKCDSYQPTELSFDTCGTLEWKILKLLYIVTLQGMDKHVFLMHTAVGSTVTACVQNNSLLPAPAWACRTRAAITRRHVFRGRGFNGARVAAVVSVSAQHGCHSGFVSWWNRIPESCFTNGNLLPRSSTSRVKTAPCHRCWTDIGGDHSLIPLFLHVNSFVFSLVFIFSFIQKQRKVLTEFCRPVSRGSFILTFPTAWHSVCWPSSPRLEGEAWGRGISGWRRWSLLKRWVIWLVTASLWSWSEHGTSFL